MPRSAYLDHDQDLQKNSIDDRGDAKYLRLEQNEPENPDLRVACPTSGWVWQLYM